MASRQMDLIFKGVDQASGTANQVNMSVRDLAKGVNVLAADVLVKYAKKLAETTIETVKLGAQSLAARDRLVAFAGGALQADAMLAALNEGADGTIDRMTAMTYASRMLETGVATNARQMEIAGAAAAYLGNQTWTLERRMQSLTMLLTVGSKLRFDDFGLSVEKVTKRQEELQAQLGMTADEARKTAIYEELAEKLGVLGDQSGSVAAQVARAESAWGTFRQSVGESLSVIVESTGVLGAVAGALDTVSERTLRVNAAIEYQRELGLSQAEALRAVDRAMQLNARAAGILEAANDGLADSIDRVTESLDQQAARMAAASAAWETYAWMQRWVAQQEVEAFLAKIEYQADVEDLTKEHQERLADIYRSGQKSLTQIAQEAHQERLRLLQDAMRAELDALSAAISERNWQQQLRNMAQQHQDRLNEIRARGVKTATDLENERYQNLLNTLNKEQQARLAALRTEYGKGKHADATKESLEEEHRRRMAGLYTKSARKAEEKRYQEALKELEYQTKEGALLEQFQAEKEAAELAHAQALAKIKQDEINASIRAENERYQRQVQQAQQARNQQKADDAARRAIEQKFAADQAALERALALEIAGIERAALAARIVAENAAFAARLAAITAHVKTVNASTAKNPIIVPIKYKALPVEHWDPGWGPKPPSFQHGGTHRGGLAIVGEKEPELLNLPPGTRITPMSKVGSLGGGGIVIHNYFGPGSVRSDRDIRQIAEDQERSLRLRGLGAIA